MGFTAVIPAQEGTQCIRVIDEPWPPAFAGVTFGQGHLRVRPSGRLRSLVEPNGD